VPLSFDAEDSLFVVFRGAAAASSLAVPEAIPVPVAKLEGPWDVSFQPGRGAPASAKLPALIPLNEDADPGIKYFSGVATYKKTFLAPSRYRAGRPLLLDLGRVGDLAEVRVNRKMMGAVWQAPFRIDIGSAVKQRQLA